ncbi:phosphatidate cytidylyltransferase [Acetitomaculum ruminis DSM 5522]|uniref:Phosphatidate cytidylyltransferase n=1 Tax=Acetitomaculum ruminis DSM 5522 TaxID=1120918 RepID=A0A1I1ABX8_9FIRM|nr:phosphatidate cytidylyltransferase [Acetitomaculum ruminis]SFB33863.1 phosphatidate cytidylyltransferase [Acetitomaculum ruminis DSM 5522]
MFKERLISGIILVVLALFLIILGGNILLLTVTVLSGIGMYELYKIADIQKNILGIISYISMIAYYVFLYFKMPDKYTIILILVLLMLLMTAYVFTFPKYKAKDVIMAVFGFIYVALMLSYIYKTRMLPGGAFSVWLIFICSWGCDTCAYCVGKLIGKHKMTPVLSPKKTIEGGIGGLIGAALLGIIYGYFTKDYVNGYSISLPLAYGIIAFVGGLISMVGDLAASAIKRDNDVKDYGNLIPGHGGILDRFDSVIFTAPVIFYLAEFLLR